jgi:hypothetical protein
VKLINNINVINPRMSTSDPMTSVPVHSSTLRLLQQFKTGAQNWDDFLLDLLEREMDKEDIEFARRVLGDYHRGADKGIPLSKVRDQFLSSRGH